MAHHGSMQYWHRRRASTRLPRSRSKPTHITEQVLSNIVAYKVGMTQVSMTDDSESPSKNIEVAEACTVLEIPPTEIYGLRAYTKDPETNYSIVDTEIYSKASAAKLKIKNLKNDESKIEPLKQRLAEITDITALAVAFPKTTSVGQHHPVRFEAYIGGKSVEEKLEFIASKLGKELLASDLFKNGEFVDVASITIGKGWQGTIRRFGTARLFHKATNKVRHVGTLGPFTPGKVLYTVPQAGQMGFHYRTEHNKRIIKIGTKADADKINPKEGYKHYGNVKNDYIIVSGSVPGPTKRLVRIKKSITNRNAKGVKEPKVTYFNLNLNTTK
ncbi:MAG TPA: 50S ribosomal protein L3 [Candidatus Acidoferrales bacterium]|nr:50S ribosomal protein L3 [Candidatus Acidoferrales bacterium]